jgi:pyruvate dehydrogenase E2 component (dihydrolipoamide acetyltransferase)
MTTHTGTTVDVTMPRLSDSMEEATILQWLKQPGERIARGEPIVEVETDKATMVYEAEREHEGVLAEIVVAEGETAALGAVIARIESDAAAAARPAPEQAAPETEPAAPKGTAAAGPKRQPHQGRPRATPVARRLAAELDVTLDGVTGSGPGGRIVRADVRRAAGSAAPTAAPSATRGGRGETTEVPLTSTQRTIAQRMSESRGSIPDFTLEAEVAMEAAHALRERLRRDGGTVPSFNDVVVKAVALALRDFPALNASFEDGRVLRHSRINVGIAVATDDALLVPTIADADRKPLAQIATEARALAERAQSRSLQLADLADGTFTVSNLGMYGVRRFQAVINAPQAAILAVGEVTPRPWVGPDGGLLARRLMDVALSCDHRVVYGAEAARFLQRLRELLEDPTQLTD